MDLSARIVSAARRAALFALLPGFALLAPAPAEAQRTLIASNITQTEARLILNGHAAAWWYRQVSPVTGACIHRPPGTIRVDLSGLTAGTSYAYEAFWQIGCQARMASVGFITLPTAPTGMNAQAGNARVAVSWTPPGGVSGYDYQQKTQASGACGTSGYGAWTPVATNTAPGGRLVIYIAPLTNGTRYCFRVRAKNASGESGPSAAVAATPAAPDTAPPTFSSAEANRATLTVTFSETLDAAARSPNDAFDVRVAGARRIVTGYSLSGSAATLTLASPVAHGQSVTVAYTRPPSGTVLQDIAGNALASFTAQTAVNRTPAPAERPGRVTGIVAEPGSGQVRLVWNPAADAAYYEYQYHYEHGNRWPCSYRWGWATLPWRRAGAAPRLTVTGLANGQRHCFRVRARNAAGRAGGTSGGVGGVPFVVSAQPRNGSVYLSWHSTGYARGYRWRWKEQASGACTRTGYTNAWNHTEAVFNVTVTGLTNGTRYCFQVDRWTLGTHDGVAATPVAPPGSAPSGVGAQAGDGQVTLRWTAVTGATSYEYQRKALASGPCGTAGYGAWTSAGAASPFAVTGLTSGTRYCFRMRSKNAGGESAASAAVAATPAAAAPAVAAFSPSDGNGSVAVDANLVLTFSEAVQRGTGTINIVPTAGGDTVTVDVTNTAQVRIGTGADAHVVTVDPPADLAAGTAYHVRIDGTAFDDTMGNSYAGIGDTTTWTFTTAAAPPDAVTNIRVTHEGNRLEVAWDAPARATHYDVTYWNHSSVVNARAAWNRAGTSLTITCDSRHEGQTVNCIDRGATYTVGVRARNAGGAGPWRNSSATPPPTPRAPVTPAPPGPVTGIAVIHNGDSLAVTWTAAARATHYDVTYWNHSTGRNARAAWNRAGTSLTIRCDSRWPGQSRDCIQSGATYTVGVRGQNAAPGSGAWRNSAPASRSALNVADATVAEPGAGATANLDFAVTLAPAVQGTVTVAYATADGTATAGSDYTATSGTLTFQAGETQKTVSVPVLPDVLNDSGETLTLTLSNASGARIARFGRTVTDHVVDAVTARLGSQRAAGLEARVAGRALPSWRPGQTAAAGPVGAGEDGRPGRAPRAETDEHRAADAMRRWTAFAGRGGTPGLGPAAGFGSRAVTGRELLTGTAFALTAEAGGPGSGGGFASLWGRGAFSGFDGRKGALALDGRVTTGFLGADWSSGSGAGSWTAGVAIGHSTGTGGYSRGGCTPAEGADAPDCGGKVEARLTGLYPYAGAALGERLSVWLAAGWGGGELTLRPSRSAALSADLEMAMGAAGVRGELLRPADGNGLSLAIKADARFTRTSSDAVTGAAGNLAASKAQVWLARAGIEGARRFALGGGGASATPSFEIGLRLDGGDAETGMGADLGGGIAFADPANGLNLDLKGRGLVAHRQPGFREWGASVSFAWSPRPARGRGPSVSLARTWGAAPSGGMDALLSRQTLAGLAAAGTDRGPGGGFRAPGRLEGEIGYGLPLFGDRFTGRPNLGFALSDDGARDWRIGWRLTSAVRGDPGFEVTLDAVRREPANSGGAPAEYPVEYRATLHGAIRW